MSKLDDASWHYGSSDFPSGLPDECGATHIGFFVRWAMERGYWGTWLPAEDDGAVQSVRDGARSARGFLMEYCDGKLLSEMLVSEIVPFAESYYDKRFLAAYHEVVGSGLASDYLVAETPENYAVVADMLDAAHRAWQKPWWKLW